MAVGIFLFRIFDAAVIHGAQNSGEGLGNFLNFFEGEMAFIQLSIDEFVIDHFTHQLIDLGGIGFI